MKKFRLPVNFRIGLDMPSSNDALRQVFPFRRSWVVIGVIAAFDAVFIIPAVTTFQQAIHEWQSLDSLFELTSAIFLSAWVLGWSIAPLIMTLVIVLMLTGREVLKVRQGVVELGIGLPGLLFSLEYEVHKMRNLRLTRPEKKSATSWRGTHLTFDYGSEVINFGSAIRGEDLSILNGQIQAAAGVPIRRGEMSSEELEEEAAWIKQASEPEPTPSEQRTVYLSESTAPVTLFSFSTIILIIANLIPVFGAMFLGWKLADVMVLYWAESAVIGFYNVLKMAVVSKWLVLLTGTFFISHFGAFMAVHFLFLYGIFIEGPSATGGGDLGDVAQLFIYLWPALAAMFLSHGISFITNYLGRKEYKSYTTEQLMKEPYSRIVFMHLVLIIGGGITLVLGTPTPVLLLVIMLKIIFDVRGHLKVHEVDKM
jgi:hypothetical protein